MPVNHTCKQCGKAFTASPSDKRQFCSKKCCYLGKRMRQPTGPIITCPICGTKRRIKPSHRDKVFTCGNKECTRSYRRLIWKQQLEKRLGEPICNVLTRLYIGERLSHRQIVKRIGISNHALIKLMRDCNIEQRYGSEAIKTQWENNTERRRQISKVFAEYAKTRKGKNHPSWTGGPIDGRYGRHDWLTYADEIRKRDGGKCTHCGMTNEEHQEQFSGYSLCVHHVVPYKLSKDSSRDNLRTLCIPCHMQIENEFKWLL